MVIAEQGGPASEEASAAAKQRALVEGVAASSAAVVEGRAVSAAADTAAKVVDTAEEAEEDEDEEVEEDAPEGSRAAIKAAVKASSTTTVKSSSQPAIAASSPHSAYAYAQVKVQRQSVAEVWSHFQPSLKHDAIVKTSPDVFEALPEFFSSRFQ